jgi:LysM repeat protein
MTSKRRIASLAVNVLVALAFLVAVLPSGTALAAQTCAKNYTVVAGDTVSKIAADNNITVQELAAANNLKDPYPLTIGQQLCIPGTATTTTTSSSSTSTSTSKEPAIKVTWEGDFVTVATANFPTKSSFYVKAGKDKVKDNVWTKIGRMQTKKVGAVETTIKLPKNFRTARALTVCVKNARTDAVLCQYVTNPV